MKNLLRVLNVLLLLTFFCSAQSQVVITKADFPLKANYESTWYQSAQANLKAPSLGENQSWDLSNLDIQNEYFTVFFDADGDDYYKNAINYQNVNYALNDFVFGSVDFYAFDDEGYAKIGRRLDETEFSIAQLTGGANDKLKISGINSPFDGRWDYIKFPLMYEDTWTQNYNIPTNYELTVEAYGLKDTPGIFINHVTETRTVAGSGEITMPNKNGGVMTLSALLIKVERTVIDSVFLGGEPAPPPLMAAFGLEQGAIATRETYVFYSPGYGESVASYDITDANITYKSLSEVKSNVENSKLNSLSIFPNPVNTGEQLKFDNVKFNFNKYIIIDQNGKKVFESKNEIFNNSIIIPKEISSGIYFIQIFTNNKLIGSDKIVVE